MNTVKYYRKICNLTQEDIAKKMGMSVNSYSNKELGKSQFTKEEMISFEKIVCQTVSNISILDIFFTDKLQKLQIKSEVNR